MQHKTNRQILTKAIKELSDIDLVFLRERMLTSCDEILNNKEVRRIETRDTSFKLYIADGENIECSKVIATTGGAPKSEQINWIKTLGHEIIDPVPSLFTFNLPNNPLNELSGIAVNPVKVRIPELKLENTGPIMITHWGLSGPSVLRLSSFGARLIADKNYNFEIQIL